MDTLAQVNNIGQRVGEFPAGSPGSHFVITGGRLTVSEYLGIQRPVIGDQCIFQAFMILVCPGLFQSSKPVMLVAENRVNEPP